MRAGDVAWAEHQCFAAKTLKIRRFGAKCYRSCRMTGQTLSDPHQFSVGDLLERRSLGEQWRVVDLDLMQFSQRL